MKKINKIILYLLFIVLYFYSGCSKEDEYIPGLEGNMVGYVYTFNEFGYPLEDHSKVRVTALGLSGRYFATSDTKGRFELVNLPTGTYELHFEKDGFGTLKQFGVQHLGGKPTILFRKGYAYYDICAYIIYCMPATEIINLKIENDTLFAEFAFEEDAQPGPMSLRIFFSNDPDFDKQTAQFVSNYILYNYNNNDEYSHPIIYRDMNFQPGETVFFKACIFTKNFTYSHFDPELPNDYRIVETDTYIDYQTNETIYPNLGDESETFSFRFPE